MNGKLESNAALKAQLDAVSAGAATSTGAQDWYAKLAKFLQDVKAGVPAKLQDADFLRRLWDENPVAATGMGSVKMAPALQDADFKAWFSAEVAKPLPSEPTKAEAYLTALYNGLRDRLKVLCGRTPRLKVNRVLCALYPEHFTTVADPGKLLYLHKEMGGAGNDHPVRAHKAIRTRIDEVLGPVDAAKQLDLVRRICLPWMVFDRISEESSPDSTSDPSAQASALKPLPATLRRKGLTLSAPI